MCMILAVSSCSIVVWGSSTHRCSPAICCKHTSATNIHCSSILIMHCVLHKRMQQGPQVLMCCSTLWLCTSTVCTTTVCCAVLCCAVLCCAVLCCAANNTKHHVIPQPPPPLLTSDPSSTSGALYHSVTTPGVTAAGGPGPTAGWKYLHAHHSSPHTPQSINQASTAWHHGFQTTADTAFNCRPSACSSSATHACRLGASSSSATHDCTHSQNDSVYELNTQDVVPA
jgi:hypothetical protein